MKIFIKRADGPQHIIIECDANGLIQHLKADIQAREKIKRASQLLFYEQQELEDHKTLKFYGIPDLATIELKVVGNHRIPLGSNRSLFYLRKKWNNQRNKERTFHKDLTLPKEELLPSGCQSIYALRNQYQKQKDERSAKSLSSWTSDIQSSPILAVAISSDSKFFASGYEDGSVKIFDMQTKKLIYCLTARIKHSVKALKVSDNSQVLVCGFEDGSLRAYEINSFKMLYEVQAHEEEILSLIITMDNKYIISTSMDSSIKILNLEDGEETAHITNVYQTKGRGGSITVSEDSKYIIAGSKEGSIKVFDFETRSELYHFQNVQSGPISSLAITRDNKKILSSSEDGSIIVFNLELKSETHCFEQIHDKNTLNLMVLSSDNRFVISSGKGELLNIINLEMNMVIQNIEGSQDEQILSLVISKDNQYIIAGSKENRIMIFNFVKKPESYDFSIFPSAQICDLVVTNQNKYIVLSTVDGSIRVFDFKTKTELCTFGNSPREVVKSFDITNDSRYIVAALADSSIKILDIKTEGMIHQIKSEQTKIVSQIKISGDYKNILVVYAQVSLAVIEFDTKNTYCHFENAHEGVIESIKWSNDSKLVISGSKDKSIKVFDVTTKSLMHHFKDAHKTCIYSLSLTPDNKHLISGSEEGSIKIFDLESNREVHYFDKVFKDRVSFLSVYNDSNFIISVSADCSVKVFDLLTKSEVYNLLNLFEQNDLSLQAISQDGRYLFARSKDTRINILSLPVMDIDDLTFVSDKIISLHSFGNYDNIILQNLHNASFLQSFKDFYTLPHRWNVLHLLAIFQPSDVSKMISYADFRVPFLVDQHNKTPLHYLIAQPKIDYNSATFMLKYIIDYLEDTSRRTFAEYEAVCASLSNIMPFIVLKINTKLVCNLLKWFFIQTPPSYEDTLPDFGLTEKKCAFSKTPVLQREIKEKIFIDGEEQIAFRSALLHLDYYLNSDDLFETVSYLNYVKDEDVFKAPVIEHLINYLWDKTYTFLITLGAVFSLLMILISIYVGLGERNLGLEIIIFIITVGILIGEAVLIKTLKKNFTNHFWNWVDLSHIILVFAFIIWRFTDDEEELARGWLSSIIIIIGYIRWISYLRLFNKTRNLIQIIISIIKDMVGFMLVLTFITIGFSLVFLEFNRDTDYSGHIYDTYKLLYGDLDDDEFSISQKLLLAFILFMLNVVLLNLLISIMGDSYDKTQERKVLTDSLTRLGMIRETLIFLRVISRKKNNNRGYLIFCEPITLQDEGDSISTEWEGRVNIIKKMLRLSEYKVGQEVSQVRQEVRRVEQKVQGIESLMLKHHQEMLDIMKDRHGSKDLICN